MYLKQCMHVLHLKFKIKVERKTNVEYGSWEFEQNTTILTGTEFKS